MLWKYLVFFIGQYQKTFHSLLGAGSTLQGPPSIKFSTDSCLYRLPILIPIKKIQCMMISKIICLVPIWPCENETDPVAYTASYTDFSFVLADAFKFSLIASEQHLIIIFKPLLKLWKYFSLLQLSLWLKWFFLFYYACQLKINRLIMEKFYIYWFRSQQEVHWETIKANTSLHSLEKLCDNIKCL